MIKKFSAQIRNDLREKCWGSWYLLRNGLETYATLLFSEENLKYINNALILILKLY